MAAGTIVTSDYSGYDTPAEAMRLVADFVRRFQSRRIEVNILRGCDWGSIQQSVLTEVSTKLMGKSMCCFQNIVERLDPSAQQFLESIRPQKKRKGAAVSESDAIDRNEQIQEYLLRNAKQVAPMSCRSYCIVHKQECPVHALAVWVGEIEPPEKSTSESASAWWAQRQQAPRHQFRAMKARKAGTTSFEDVEIDFADAAASEAMSGKRIVGAQTFAPPLSLHFAGLSCTDYSPA
eukprot:4454125-Amphidinium_carterae.1